MRTTDFSLAPDLGQANAEFVGGTNFTSLISLMELCTKWQALKKRLVKAPGYKGHRVWYRFPFVIGTIAFFADKDSLMAFARTPEHAEIMKWVMNPGKARGGFIRVYEALPHGYSSGVWRAEGNEMKAIENFSPLTSEGDGPPVSEFQSK
jgi:hypothetical protein